MDPLRAVHVSSFLLTAVFFGAAKLGPATTWAPGVLVLSFLHFASTLVLFYRDPEVAKKRPVLGLALPLAILGVSFFWAWASPTSWPQALILFFPVLFWHYSKQSMGIFVLGLRGSPGMSDPRSQPRQIILAVFLFLGTFGYLSSQMGTALSQSFGFYIPSMGLGAGPWIQAFRGLSVAGLSYLAYVCWREKAFLPFLTALAFYAWMDFSLLGFSLLPFLPALHALQYLPLAFARWRRSAPAWVFLAGTVVITTVIFAALRWTPRTFLAVGLFLSSLELVMNVHHYFLDAYIWRARDERNRQELGL